jgi:hypothetical protein
VASLNEKHSEGAFDDSSLMIAPAPGTVSLAG